MSNNNKKILIFQTYIPFSLRFNKRSLDPRFSQTKYRESGYLTGSKSLTLRKEKQKKKSNITNINFNLN